MTRNQIGSVEKLKQLAETIVPELKKRIKVPRAHRVERLFAKVKKSWVGMTPEQQSDFDKRFSDLRNSTKTPVTA